MTAQTQRTLLWIGGAALAALAIGGVAYAATAKPAPAVPSATPTTPGTPVPATTGFQPGQVYTFAALLSAGITTAQQLATSLTQTGWSGVSIWYFGPTGQGTLVGGLQATQTGYVASGTYNGTAQPLPANVVALTGNLGPTGVTPVATA